MTVRWGRVDAKWLYAVASGILLALSFPKYGSGIVAWIALVPLLRALKDEAVGARKGFFLGLACGFVAYVGIIYWITYVVVHYGYLPYWMGIGATVILSLYLAVYIALFAAGVAVLRQRGVPPVLSAPLLWTSLEYAKSVLLTGFPWENLGYSQYLNTYLVQIADITGVAGITFLIVLTNAILADMPEIKEDRKRVTVQFAAGVVLIAAANSYGLWRLDRIDKALAQAPAMDVTLVQGNIEQDIKWNPAYQKGTIDVYRRFSLENPTKGGLIVWPETAMPFFFQDMTEMRQAVAGVARETGSMLLFGSPAYKRKDSDIVLYNSAYLLSPEGDAVGRYDKVHLVPFGEYVPLRKLLPFMSKIVVGVGDFETGPGFVPIAGGKHKLGVLICYEGILAEAGRDYKRAGADLLVNITNDAWFGNTSAPYQHLSMATLRAVETRLTMVRTANTGITAIIDPAGRIVDRTPIFTRCKLAGKIKFIDEATLYGAYGDIFIYLNIFMMTAMLGYAVKKGGTK